VIPDTLLGLLLFVGSIGPGYIWVLVAERRRPREQRSAILEAAELAFVGILTTGLSSLIVLAIADGWYQLEIDTSELAQSGGAYLLEEPVRGIGTLMAIVVLSFGLAYAAARLLHRGPSPLKPGFAVWDEVFRLGHEETAVFATAELRDRRRFSGWVYTWDAGAEDEPRDLSLHAPISVKAPGAEPHELTGVHFLVLREPEIVWLSAEWTPAPAELAGG
jgi:hypothetical protein